MDNNQIGIRNQAYENSQRELKEHEKIMLSLIKEHLGSKKIDILDIGCADGIFLEFLSEEIDCKNIIGIDNDKILVETANARKYKAENHHIYFDDIDEITQKKQFIHPEHGKRISLLENIGLYAWHGNHHLAHIKQAITSKGKFNEAPVNHTINQ